MLEEMEQGIILVGTWGLLGTPAEKAPLLALSSQMTQETRALWGPSVHGRSVFLL